MDKKQLIKIGGIVLGTVLTIGLAAYEQARKQKENTILLDDKDYDILEAGSKADSRQ